MHYEHMAYVNLIHKCVVKGKCSVFFLLINLKQLAAFLDSFLHRRKTTYSLATALFLSTRCINRHLLVILLTLELD